MGTFASTAALLPGRNPAGGASPTNPLLPAVGSTSGQNPVMPPTNLPPGAPASNPYAPGSSVPTFGANSGGYSPTSLLPSAPGQTGPLPNATQAAQSPIGGISNMTPKDISRMYSSLKKTYGDGVAHAILDFLTSGAGFNQKAIDNIFAALQPGIERGTESLMEQFSTSGNRFGSGAQIGLADYLSQVQLNEGQLETQMYEQSVSNYINTLMGVGGAVAQTKANSPSFMDNLTSLLPTIGAGAGAASAAGVGGTAGSILDVIASLCWVASELYGGWFAPETVTIRDWLLRTWYMAPFVALYRRYGKQWAAFIKTHRAARKVTRKVFDVFLRVANA